MVETDLICIEEREPSRVIGRSRSRRRTALLNPYVVVADVAINLLLIVVAYFLVSSRITDAYYAAQERQFLVSARRYPNLERQCRKMLRNGSELYFRFPNDALFSGDSRQLRPAGEKAVQELASLLTQPELRPRVRMIRTTVTYPTEWNFNGAPEQADSLAALLKQNGVRAVIVPSGRSQRSSEVNYSRQQLYSETEFAIELKPSGTTEGR